MVDSCYAPTRWFCDKTLKRYGIETTYYDPCIGAGIEALFRPNTKAVFCESPGSLTFEVQDVPAIAAVAHARGASVLLDNTWATPLLFRRVRAWRRSLDSGGDQIYRRPCRCDDRLCLRPTKVTPRGWRKRMTISASMPAATIVSSRCAACAPCRCA